MAKEFTLPIKFNSSLFLNFSRLFSHHVGTCVLYSGGNYESAQLSFLCLFPYETVWIEGQTLWKECLMGDRMSYSIPVNPWETLRQNLVFPQRGNTFPEWIGFLSYELGAYADEVRNPYISSVNLFRFPEAFFQKCALILSVDHLSGQGRVLVMDHGLYLLQEEEKEWVERLSSPHHWEELAKNLENVEVSSSYGSPLEWVKPMECYEEYKKKIEVVQDLIRSGDVYQVNLSHQLFLKGKRDPFETFFRLGQINPAPFSAYLRLKDFVIVSSSPERFLSKKEGWLETRPIKGTIPRGRNLDEDQKNLELLIHSEKENAELLMITDLMRNDLSKVSIPGSVQVTQLRTCEAYENVYHLLSIIRSQPLQELSPLEVLRACFPGGSITGCPKLKAMKVISEMEKRPRGIYTGSIGYFAGNGDFDFNIAIRTLLLRDQEIDIQLGGGIVADSEPEKEYEETLQKGASIFKALGGLNTR